MKSYNKQLGDTIFTVYLQRKKRKRLKIALVEQNTIEAELPYLMSVHKLMDFIEAKKAWILRNNKKMQGLIFIPAFSEEEERKNRLRLKEEAWAFYREISEEVFPFLPQKIQVRKQKSRWGSCSSKKTISLNVYLMALPKALREYVYYHELCHLKHPHHQKSFWEDLEKLCPQTKQLERELKRYRLPL